MWQCQENDCQDKGPYRELMIRCCKRKTAPTPAEVEANFIAALTDVKQHGQA